MAKLKPKDVEFLTFQGGGGKGTVYGGPIALLEQLGHLPMIRRESDGERLYPPVKGVSGSSAGAITAFTLALGMKLEDLNRGIDEKHFGRFFEKPVPGLYKAVKYIRDYENKDLGIPKGDYNVPGYAVDKLVWKPGLKSEGKEKYLELFAKVTRFYEKLEDAKKDARRNFKTYKSHSFGITQVGSGGYKFIRMIGNGLASIPEAFGKKYETHQNQLVESIKKHPVKYLKSLKYDRGLFTGIETRNYFAELLYKALKNVVNGEEGKDDKIFLCEDVNKVLGFELSEDNAPFVTFKQLYEITGVHLVIQGVNIINSYACTYSHQATPDYPVVDAVCSSMSIPFAFKPTFSDSKVDFRLEEREAKNLEFLLRHNGFIVDGGLLNNLPVHAFNHKKGSDTQLTGSQIAENFLEDLNPKVLAFSLREGFRLKENVPQGLEGLIEADIWMDETFTSGLKNCPRKGKVARNDIKTGGKKRKKYWKVLMRSQQVIQPEVHKYQK